MFAVCFQVIFFREDILRLSIQDQLRYLSRQLSFRVTFLTNSTLSRFTAAILTRLRRSSLLPVRYICIVVSGFRNHRLGLKRLPGLMTRLRSKLCSHLQVLLASSAVPTQLLRLSSRIKSVGDRMLYFVYRCIFIYAELIYIFVRLLL